MRITMISVKELVDGLVDTELANLSMKIDGELKPNRLKQIIFNMNLGLTDLYTKFNLKQVEIKYISSEHDTMFSPVADTSYEILGVLDVFYNDCRLDTVGEKSYRRTNASNGASISLNFVPDKGSMITIISKANHRKLTEEDYHNNTLCELPVSFISALYYFIASRLYTSINNQLDGDLNESARYVQLYAQEINHLTQQAITTDEYRDTHWFRQRGFV